MIKQKLLAAHHGPGEVLHRFSPAIFSLLPFLPSAGVGEKTDRVRLFLLGGESGERTEEKGVDRFFFSYFL